MGSLDRREKEAMENAIEVTKVALDHLAKMGVDPGAVSPHRLNRLAIRRGYSRATANVAGSLLAHALKTQDKALQRRSARIAHRMQVALQKAFPELDPQFIGDIVADLNSLWDTGQKLDKQLKRLFQMRFPQHRNHLREFLAFIEATQIDMVEFWIGNLRKRIPKLRQALDRQERDERRARPHSPKKARKLAAKVRA